jgi:hypothetical protein
MKLGITIRSTLALCFALTGCLGDESRDNELIGQVKKVQSVTPWVLFVMALDRCQVKTSGCMFPTMPTLRCWKLLQNQVA